VKILADENMKRESVVELRAADHDVHWAYEIYRGTPDANLLEIATADARLLITYDNDYGELVRRLGTPAPYGVILFRIHDDVPTDAETKFIVGSVTIQDDWPPGLWTIQIRHSE
jgi:predicted nuclease of predicted toxin-antitoxin system